MQPPIRRRYRLITVIRGLTCLLWVALVYQPVLAARPLPEPSMQAEPWSASAASGGVAHAPDSAPDTITGTVQMPEVLYRTPVDPNAVYLPGPTSPPTGLPATPSTAEERPAAAGDFALYRNTTISGAD